MCPLLVFVGTQPRCELMLLYEDWEKVENHSAYKKFVKPKWDKYLPGGSCGKWGSAEKQCCFK